MAVDQNAIHIEDHGLEMLGVQIRDESRQKFPLHARPG
jgi:hypothetical protein